MNSHDERGNIFPVDAQGNNATSVQNSHSSTIKIDSLCIKLGFVKEKDDAEKCSHFSIRGYVYGMRERGGSNLLPFSEKLPPIDVPHFRYWLCQSCLQNRGTSTTSHETLLPSVCDQSVVQPCASSCPPQDCVRIAVLPFGEGTSGLKYLESMDDHDDDDHVRVLPALGVNESQPAHEIPADNTVPQEPITFCSSDTNVASEANAGTLCRNDRNDGRDDEDPQQDTVVKETITGLVGPPSQSSQQNDHPSGHTRRKARKVRLLKELCGNNESQHRKKKNSAILIPRASSPLPPSSQIKRKIPHDQDQDRDRDQRSVDITTCKKAKACKGNAVAKATMVEHCKDTGVSEGAQNDNKYIWIKHGTQRSSIVGKLSSDPVTAWRSIFSDMGKTDNQVTTSRPTYDIPKDRDSEPYSKSMAPPHPDKKINDFKKISKNSLKSKFFGDYSTRENVSGGFRPKDRQSETELGLGLSLNFDPQAQLRSIPSTLNCPPNKDYSRKGDFFFGESSISHRILSDSISKEAVSIHGVSNRHGSRPMLLQDQHPYAYGSCSGHQKLDFSDPHKRNTGLRGYSDIVRPHNHQRQQKMVRIDEREIVELMAKNQYERNLCEARGSRNNSIPYTTSFHNVNMNERMTASSNQEYLHMIRHSTSMMSEKSNVRPNTAKSPPSGFLHQEQASGFNMFDGFQQSRNQPSSGIWMSDSRGQRHPNSCYHHVPKGNNKMTNTHLYTPANIQVFESLNKYNNGRHQNETTDVFSNFSTSMPFGQGYSKRTEKGIMDLDLNVMAPNVIDEQNNLESLNMTSSTEYDHYHPKNTRSLDSSYPSEAIPAMQLLSLMDAGKSNHPLMDERKFSKPLSPCYTHCSTTITGKSKPIANPHFPCPGVRPGGQNPIQSSRHFHSSSLGVGNSFSCGFQTSQDVKLTSGQGYYVRPEESYDFPLPWHASENRSERVNLGTRIEPMETEICTINKNPADFSTPGPENVYMINVEDLVFKGESSYKGKSAPNYTNGQKWQKRS